jgi:hypothetical protein
MEILPAVKRQTNLFRGSYTTGGTREGRVFVMIGRQEVLRLRSRGRTDGILTLLRNSARLPAAGRLLAEKAQAG